jgi:hypothetical protein
MNQSEHTFGNLKRLLKLKRHEVPPPGYFNTFSDSVISRIRAGEAGGAQSATERLHVTAPWLVNFLNIFETKPGLIGGFAVSLCLLLVLGVVFSERSDSATKNILATVQSAPAGDSLASVAAPPMASVADSSGIIASTNPVTSLQPVATMFGQPNPALFQAASFAPAGTGN